MSTRDVVTGPTENEALTPRQLRGGLDLPPRVTKSVIEVLHLPRTPADFRRVLGFADQPVVAPEEALREKKARVERYAAEQKADIPDNWYALGREDLSYWDDRITAQTADNSISARLWRKLTQASLRRNGIQQSEQVLQAVEESILISRRRDVKPAVLVGLIKTLDPGNETEGIRKFRLAIGRARQFHLVPASGDLEFQNEFVDFMTTLANFTDEGFQRICRQFEGNKGVISHENNFCAGFGDSGKNGLLQVLKQGGLTVTQQQTLERAFVWRDFADYVPLIKEKSEDDFLKGDFVYSLKYSQLLDSKTAEGIDRYYPLLIDWAAGRLPARNGSDGGSQGTLAASCGGRDFVVSIQHLDVTGRLPQLTALIDSGWDCTSVYQAMKGANYDPDTSGQYEQIDRILSSATGLQSDCGKIAWAKALSGFYYGSSRLSTSGISSYEVMVNNRDKFIESATILNSLPARLDNFQFADLLVLGQGEVGIDQFQLRNYLERLSKQPGVADLDRSYILGISNLLGIQSGEYYEGRSSECVSTNRLSLIAYLAANRDRLSSQVFDSDGNFHNISVQVINELFETQLPLDNQLMQDLISRCYDQSSLSPYLKIAYFDSLSQPVRSTVLTALPPEFLSTLERESQLLIFFFQQLPPLIRTNLTNGGKSELLRYISGGRPTAVMLERALDIGYLDAIRQHVTEDLLALFDPQERKFFQACLSLPPDALRLLAGLKSSWSSYFSDGKVTPDFLTMVSIASSAGLIDQVLAAADLSSFSPHDIEFWSFYRRLPQCPYMRKFLLSRQNRFSELVVGGQPTPQFLEDATKAGDLGINTIRELLPYYRVAEMPPKQRAFWEFYPSVDRQGITTIRNYLLGNKDRFEEFIAEGKPTLSFLNEVGLLTARGEFKGVQLIEEILGEIEWDRLPPYEQGFWQYYRNNSSFAPIFILRNRNQFLQMVVNGEETPLFYKLLATQEPNLMLALPTLKPDLSARQYQDIWGLALGKEVINGFLAVLPKATDEARNAFTCNDFDRATLFIQYLLGKVPPDQFSLSPENFSIMAAYIRQFGLAKNEAMYRYFRALHLFENGQVSALPEEMQTLGITSTAEMFQRFTEVRRMVFGEAQLTDATQLRSLTPFQIQVLASVTRYDHARFGGGDGDRLSLKIREFVFGLEQSMIAPLPEEYLPETIESSDIRVEFNADAVRSDYAVLRGDILECIDCPPTPDQLKAQVRLVVDRRIGKIRDTLGRVTNEKAIAGITRDLGNYQAFLIQLGNVTDIDSLALSLLSMGFSNEDKAGGEGFVGIDSVMRRIVLSKLFKRGDRSPGFIENVRVKLSGEVVSAEGIDEIVLTVDEMIKNHVLNLDQKSGERYWRKDIVEAILSNNSLRNNFRRITDRFNPHIDKLRHEQAMFKRIQTGKVSSVRVIPDRGFVGEMAGYLADVCYVRVSDMLQTYSGVSPEKPLVVPYKFVTLDPETNDPAFVGSVLVFEVQTGAGEPALLVKALDIPNELEMDVGKFTENLLDRFAALGKRRGKKRVLVAGTANTISNYSAVTAHVINKYVTGRAPEPVDPDFDFNRYNITNNIYTARIIE